MGSRQEYASRQLGAAAEMVGEVIAGGRKGYGALAKEDLELLEDALERIELASVAIAAIR